MFQVYRKLVSVSRGDLRRATQLLQMCAGLATTEQPATVSLVDELAGVRECVSVPLSVCSGFWMDRWCLQPGYSTWWLLAKANPYHAFRCVVSCFLGFFCDPIDEQQAAQDAIADAYATDQLLVEVGTQTMTAFLYITPFTAASGFSE